MGHFFPAGLAYFKVRQSHSLLPYRGAIKWIVFIFLTFHCFALFSYQRSVQEQVNSLYLPLTYLSSSKVNNSLLPCVPPTCIFIITSEIRLLHTKHCKDPSQEDVSAAKTLRMKTMQLASGTLWTQLAYRCMGNRQQGLPCSAFLAVTSVKVPLTLDLSVCTR